MQLSVDLQTTHAFALAALRSPSECVCVCARVFVCQFDVDVCFYAGVLVLHFYYCATALHCGTTSLQTYCVSLEIHRWWHRMEVNFSIRLLGHHAKEIRPLSEEKAVAQGAEVLGEGVIFGIAASLLVIGTDLPFSVSRM